MVLGRGQQPLVAGQPVVSNGWLVVQAHSLTHMSWKSPTLLVNSLGGGWGVFWQVDNENGLDTGCIKGFFEVEKVQQITNSISKFCALESVIKVKIFLLCHSLFLKKSSTLLTLFKEQNLLVEFVISIAFPYTFLLQKPFYKPCVGCRDLLMYGVISHLILGGQINGCILTVEDIKLWAQLFYSEMLTCPAQPLNLDHPPGM